VPSLPDADNLPHTSVRLRLRWDGALTHAASPMKKTDVLQNLVTGVLVVCAVVVTGLLVRRELFAPTPAGPGAPPPPSVVSGWRAYANGGNGSGPGGAPVTIVEFSDFQCPFCRLMAARLDSLRAEHPRDVRVVYRHFPLPSIHPHAIQAAQASECAGEQGRFWPMHDALFARQDSIGKTGWERFAETAGVANLAAFTACMSRPGESTALHPDTAAGNELGIRSTPTLLINQHRINGAISLDSLRAFVRRGAR
jgi:protein-disulfide isomerase